MSAINPPFDYASVHANFSFSVPERFNFAFDIVDQRAQQSDKIALIAINRAADAVRYYRYSDLERESNRFANALLAMGVNKGDAVLVVLPRIAAWYFVILGCTKIGAVAMPGTNQLKAKDLAYRIHRSDAKIAIVTASHTEAIESIHEHCPSLKHRIVVGAQRPGWDRFESLCEQADDRLDRSSIPATRSEETMLS